jgi:hypothetical protein
MRLRSAADALVMEYLAAGPLCPLFGDVFEATGVMGDWSELNGWTERLRARFADAGVVRVEYVIGFVKPYHVTVWLGTESDAQRDELATPGLSAEVSSVLADVGMSGTDYSYGGAVVQSEETVTRDYEGSWFYALR